MALLDKEKEKNSANNNEKVFENIIIDTEDVNQELKNISSSQNIPLEQLDFKLITFRSVYRTHKDEEWTEIKKSNIMFFKDEDFLLNPDLSIRQQYKIEIFKKDSNSEKLLEVALGGNKYLTKVLATVKKSFDVKYSSKIKDFITQEINKKLMKQSMLISICENEMEKEIDKIVSKIRVNNFLDNDHTFVVCHCVDPIFPINDKIIFHYRKNIDKKDTEGKIDYSRRGFIQPVKEGDVVIEYVKSKEGRNGRNCKGEFLKVKKPLQKYSANLSITENIERKEDEDRVIFVAKRNGYVKKEGDKYDISDNMEVNEVSFKTTGSIEANMDSNVKINIKEKDALKDAIGPGMVVETTEIKVEGNVGSGASIKAKKAEIGGQTHKTSTIEAEDLTIAVHRGLAVGNQVKINRLEGGRVDARVVEIEQAIGGEVIADKIIIKQLVSNTILTASHLIEIAELKGNNNKLIIDPSKVLDFEEKIKELNTKLKETSVNINLIKKDMIKKKAVIEKNKEAAMLVRQKILELKKQGREPAKTLMKKIKDYKQMVDSYNLLLEDYKKGQNEITLLEKEIEKIQTTVFDAKVINHSVWSEYNEIKFVLLSPKTEISYVTKDSEVAKNITLQEIEKGKYEIKKKNEYS